MTFELLNIDKQIIRALKEDNILSPTQIQKMAIPLIKSGKDVIGMSNTGSGKTAAFGIPTLEMITPKKGVQVLVLVPTRELAVQITNELRKFSRYIKCSIATVYGGVAIGPQMDKVARADIVVGTTGRVMDHLQRKTMDLASLKCVVLDEADKMVDMGFIDDIESILKKIPKNRQILLFGATTSPDINKIKSRHMSNPQTAKADVHVKEAFLEQYYYDVRPHEKFSLLVHLLKKEQTERVIIFCSTIVNVEILTRNLKAQGLEVEMIHGKLNQSKRLKIIDNFNQGKPKILVASAVAARGLDIRNVSHVFNYSLSSDSQEYIHRVGRTARAGESGKAITLLEPRDHDAFTAILENHRLKVQRLPEEEFEKLDFRVQSKSHGGGQRGSFGRNGRRDNRDDKRSGGGGWGNSRRSSGDGRRTSQRGGNSKNRSFGRSNTARNRDFFSRRR